MDRKQFIKLLGAGVMGVAGATSFSCGRQPAEEAGKAGRRTRNWVWVGGREQPLDAWQQQFARMRAAGIDAVLLHERIDNLAGVLQAARQEGLEAHIWMIAMMQGGMEETHPAWYAVNRKGTSTATDPPYVDYYKFMCPSREPVQEHLAAQVGRLAQMDGVTSVHLDYIRYPDVILPVALWPKYNLVQDREYPEFDYCYCEVCRERFKQQTGIDPLELEDPPSNEAWLRYRYDTITHVVNRLADVAHGYDRQLTAAVFPTPDIARRLVRQDWTRWNLDAVLPMIYHSFYNEDVAWVETATREGVEALAGKFPLYSGLFVPELDPEQLAEAARGALAGGAGGVVLFEAKAPTEAHWQQLAGVLHA